MKITIDVPDGVSGDWKVTTFEITQEQASLENLRCTINGRANRYVMPGIYKRLSRGGQIVMSNTPAEIRDHILFIHEAKHSESILINGLGLGVALKEILKSKTLKSITIIEQSLDVIALVSPTYSIDPRVEIIHADAFTWKAPKGMHWDVVWHDIWDDICTTNLKQMEKLHRKYGSRCSWQGSWAKELCLTQRRRERRNAWDY